MMSLERLLLYSPHLRLVFLVVNHMLKVLASIVALYDIAHLS